jgi:ABC-type uncharacterized transport system substrate-binding protein
VSPYLPTALICIDYIVNCDDTPLAHIRRFAYQNVLCWQPHHRVKRVVAVDFVDMAGVKVYRVISFNELEPALAAMIDDRMNGLATFQGALAFVNRKLIVDFAAEHRLPAVYQATAFAESGGLMAWAPDLKEQFRVAARNVDKILKGTKAGDIPIQYPPRYYLTINTRTAADLGLTVPETLIAEADQVLR